MTHSQTKTPLAFWLFMHGLSARAAAHLFRTNRATLANVAAGRTVPSGQTRDLIAQALLGEVTIDQLNALAGHLPASGRVTAPGGESIPPGGFS